MEFAFTLIMIALMMYALMKAFRWAGMDLAERSMSSDTYLYSNIDENWKVGELSTKSPFIQLKTNYYRSKRMGLVYNQW